MDTAAVMTCLDLVIMSDTAVAHLTELLGVPGWITLSAMPDRRRLSVRDDNSCYPGDADLPRRTFMEWGPGFDRIGVVLRRWDIEAARRRPTLGRN